MGINVNDLRQASIDLSRTGHTPFDAPWLLASAATEIELLRAELWKCALAGNTIHNEERNVKHAERFKS